VISCDNPASHCSAQQSSKDHYFPSNLVQNQISYSKEYHIQIQLLLEQRSDWGIFPRNEQQAIQCGKIIMLKLSIPSLKLLSNLVQKQQRLHLNIRVIINFIGTQMMSIVLFTPPRSRKSHYYISINSSNLSHRCISLMIHTMSDPPPLQFANC